MSHMLMTVAAVYATCMSVGVATHGYHRDDTLNMVFGAIGAVLGTVQFMVLNG